MTIRELRAFFEEHRVPKKLYSLKGNHNHRICLEQDKSGWEVYFSDKKAKVGLMRFASEGEACGRMKDEIKKVMELAYGLTWARIPG